MSLWQQPSSGNAVGAKEAPYTLFQIKCAELSLPPIESPYWPGSFHDRGPLRT
jgi:hypothetical protein